MTGTMSYGWQLLLVLMATWQLWVVKEAWWWSNTILPAVKYTVVPPWQPDVSNSRPLLVIDLSHDSEALYSIKTIYSLMILYRTHAPFNTVFSDSRGKEFSSLKRFLGFLLNTVINQSVVTTWGLTIHWDVKQRTCSLLQDKILWYHGAAVSWLVESTPFWRSTIFSLGPQWAQFKETSLENSAEKLFKGVAQTHEKVFTEMLMPLSLVVTGTIIQFKVLCFSEVII